MQQKRQKIKKRLINKERLEFEKLLEIGRLVKNDKKGSRPLFIVMQMAVFPTDQL